MKTELSAIKEFRTDLNSVNEVLLQEIRIENKNLRWTFKTYTKKKFFKILSFKLPPPPLYKTVITRKLLKKKTTFRLK